ncbi:glycoside hydrolase family 2 TIM barrel-domain containing protein [Sediminibacillus albus]|uniref:Beta-galactosidase n=1 Tax=Sediminibacillus albus TaxID=407036 RepID=A0A1G8Y9F2_9BACI|nr:glycoside hydrolase family 2 TIM barrel-domain containing protein [Sediminibacillus albus]SDJ99376.1 beta-galactosidase [Sediminibacillus albus]
MQSHSFIRHLGFIIFLLLFISIFKLPGSVSAEEEISNWNGTPELFQENRLPGSVTTIPHNNEKASIKGAIEKSRFYKSLNGNWKFRWSENPNERPKDFYKPNFQDSDWDTIPVPGNWQLQGYGDIIYLNQEHPWQGYGTISPPEVPIEHNEVGSYRHTFQIPGNWKKGEIFLSFQGVKSAFNVWVNGKKVGYSEDSFTPAEFNISDYVKNGKNTLAVEVFRWSDGAWLENQDMVDLSGIFRDVYLYATPKVHIEDYKLETDLDADYEDAVLDIDGQLMNQETINPNKYAIEAKLFDQDNKQLDLQETLIMVDSDGTFQSEITVENPLKWSAEQPNLYTLVLNVKDAKDKTVETISSKVGFREIEIEDKQVKINGQPIMIKGVNRHEVDPDTGYVMSEERLREDIEIMKQNNINAVRTGHYPFHPRFYELADEYGIYILDEANNESHNMRPFPGNNPAWTPAVKDRIQSMVERDKNHPSVIFWSMGNEVGSGDVFRETSQWIKDYDPTRPLHFQQDNSLADFDSFMYPSLSKLESYGERNERPLIMCEYEHAMGNSLGNIKEYWEIIDKYDNLQGGFIWDFVDQSVRLPVDGGVDGLPIKDDYQGETYFSYGGDWGDYANDGIFLMNGLLNPDRTAQPEMFALKAVYQNVDVHAVDLAKNKISIQNENLFTNLKTFAGKWQLKEDDKVIQEGTINQDIAGNSSKEVTLPLEQPENTKEGAEYWLNISYTLAEDTAWAEKGYEVANAQLKIPYETPPSPEFAAENMPELDVEDGEARIEVTGDLFSLTFNKAEGTITSFKQNGQELVKSGPKPNFWRARNDNDLMNGMLARNESWQHAGENMDVTDVQVRAISDSVVHVQVTASLPTTGESFYRVGYFIYGSGEVVVRSTVKPSTAMSEIPAVGMELTLPGQYDNIRYYGRGPFENYWDRKDGANVGVYQSTVEEQFFNYPRPQETGNKTDVRWLTLTGDDGNGLLVGGLPQFEFSALHYTENDLEQAGHPFELNKLEDIVLTINHKQMGVWNSWGGTALPEYMLYTDQSYSYTYMLRPITDGESAMELSKRQIDLNLLKDIKVDGESLEGFHTDVTKYTYTFSNALDNSIPSVEVIPARADVEIEVEQTEELPGSTIIHARTADGFLEETYTIDFNPVSDLYISDIQWESATTGWGTIQKDQSVAGPPITLLDEDGPVLYDKGIGVHANSEIVYDLSKWEFDRFETYAGVEQHADRDGNRFIFEVWLDGELAYQTEPMRKSTPQEFISVDIKDSQQLKLVMRTIEGGSNGHGHGAWANAKLVTQEEDALESASLTVDPPSVSPGGLAHLNVTATTASGKAINLDNSQVEFHSSEPSIVTFDTQYEDLLMYVESNTGEIDAFNLWATVTIEGKHVETNKVEVTIQKQ